VEKSIAGSAFDLVNFTAVDLFGRESSTTYAHPPYCLGIDLVVPASPTLSNVRYQTTANLYLVDNELDIQLTDSALFLGPFDLSAFNALNSIFSQINFSLEGVLEGFIEDAIENELPGLMLDLIAPLWVETDSQGDISGKLFGTDVDVSKLVTQDRSFDFNLDTNIVPLSLGLVPDVLGSSYHAAVVVSEVLINQTLSVPMDFFFKHGVSLSTKIEGVPEVSISFLYLNSPDFEWGHRPCGLPTVTLHFWLWRGTLRKPNKRGFYFPCMSLVSFGVVKAPKDTSTESH